MYGLELHSVLLWIQHSISFAGIIVISTGVIRAIYQYACYLISKKTQKSEININKIRLDLGRVLVLGLEFIVAADLIGTTTAPDYYSVGIVAAIVAIRTLLSFTLNREIADLSKST